MKQCSLNSTGVKLSIDFHYSLLVRCEKADLGRQVASRCCYAEHLLSPLQGEQEKLQVCANALLLSKASILVSLCIQYRLSQHYDNKVHPGSKHC